MPGGKVEHPEPSPRPSTVARLNVEGESHTVVSPSGLFRSGGPDSCENCWFGFDQPDHYAIRSSIHPSWWPR
jgi:hypothetical protein